MNSDEVVPLRAVGEDCPNAPHHARGRGHCALVTWLIVLLVTVSLWAIWATFMVVDMGASLTSFQDSTFKTHIQFVLSPETNKDHYERILQVGGTQGDYTCVYDSGYGRCHNEDSYAVIWWTPQGPMYRRLDLNQTDAILYYSTYPFGTTQYQY